MPDYSKGKIYKLVGGGLTYYGSTVNELRYRLKLHKAHFKQNINITSKLLFETGDEVKIFLVEKFPCADKMELNARERWYIEQNDCVNKVMPTRTQKQYYETNKGQIKQYYEDNKEKIKEQHKLYREVNKDKIKQKKSEKITCECGAVIHKNSLYNHNKSIKHLNKINGK